MLVWSSEAGNINGEKRKKELYKSNLHAETVELKINILKKNVSRISPGYALLLTKSSGYTFIVIQNKIC